MGQIPRSIEHIGSYFYVFYVFTFFFKIHKVVTFYVFCRVSYIFSNYAPNIWKMIAAALLAGGSA